MFYLVEETLILCSSRFQLLIIFSAADQSGTCEMKSQIPFVHMIYKPGSQQCNIILFTAAWELHTLREHGRPVFGLWAGASTGLLEIKLYQSSRWKTSKNWGIFSYFRGKTSKQQTSFSLSSIVKTLSPEALMKRRLLPDDLKATQPHVNPCFH